MTRKASISSADPAVNGRLDGASDAAEPEHVTEDELAFDPAELEAEAPAPPSTPAGRDPFDPAFLGLTQDFTAEAGVAKKWDLIKVEKPSKSRVFRVHPGPRGAGNPFAEPRAGW